MSVCPLCILKPFNRLWLNLVVWYRDRLDFWQEDRLILKGKGPIQEGAQEGFITMDIFVCKSLLLVHNNNNNNNNNK